MPSDAFPEMLLVRQHFDSPPRVDIQQAVQNEFAKIESALRPGMKVGVTAGSRGIGAIAEILKAVVDHLKSRQCRPFILPAMGSHGGATPEGQTALLAGYGITEAFLGVPVRPSMEVEVLGEIEGKTQVYFSREALTADAIILVNRIKPHTDFGGSFGSGLQKMLAIGLGKQRGAAALHAASSRHGYVSIIQPAAALLLDKTPLLAGVGVVENAWHQPGRIELLPREQLVDGEARLLELARQWMPGLPFDDVDLLVIDEIGKNISGTGMDTNLIGRTVHGYLSSLKPSGRTPFVRRVAVRNLTPETKGNAIGIGMADFTTRRVIDAMDRPATYVNTLTSNTPQNAKLPMYYDTDREMISTALQTLALAEIKDARLLRIRNTLSLDRFHCSRAFTPEIESRAELEVEIDCGAVAFDEKGSLIPEAI